MSLSRIEIPESMKFTYEDYRNLPDNGTRYEILAGELLMSPSPTRLHQIILLELSSRLNAFVKSHNLGQIFIAPFDVVLSKHNVVQPDIVFVSQKQQHLVFETHIHGAPDLIVEILSPGSIRRDRDIKRKIYSKFGVTEYWIVNPRQRTVEVYRLRNQVLRRAEIFRDADVLTSPLLPGFELPVNLVFPKNIG
ncbi:MAG: Uma2 family endonuclease [Calditrichaeota bacterium]|nr:MAG: Uma2 family endonuclease [Calditrichota bacterium]